MGIRISKLPAIATPALSDIFPVVQSGVTYKESFTQLTSLFATAGANSNITSLTGLTGVIQAPTFIEDAAGAPILGFNYQPLAVNYISLTNGIAGVGVVMSAQGSDTDIAYSIVAKGASDVAIHGALGGIEPVSFLNGTNYQHKTSFSFANTSANRFVTWPDFDGTINLTSKANGTEAANAVTASGTAGVITTSSLTTASGSAYAITWTNTFIATSSIIILSLMGGTNTRNSIELMATAGSGTSTLTITNNNASALNGTVIIGYLVIP